MILVILHKQKIGASSSQPTTNKECPAYKVTTHKATKANITFTTIQ
jgi:hypothetical protein